MSYLGRSVDAISNVEKLDNITFDGSTSYALTKSSAAFTPAGKNNILISVSGVVQQGNFSVSGSNIVFDSAVAGTESCDFIMHYGTGLITTPADDTVSTATIQNDAVTVDKLNLISTSSVPSLEAKGTSGQTDGYIQLNCEQNSHGIKLKSPPHSAGQSYTLTFPSTAPATDKILQTNSSGVLSFVDAPSGGLQFIKSTSSSSEVSNLTLDDAFTAAYTNYLIVGEYTLINGSGPYARFVFRQGGSSGSDLTGAEYNYHFIRMNADSDSLNNHRSQGNNYCEFTAPTNNDSGRVGIRLAWTVFDPFTSGKRTTVSGTGKMTATDANSASIMGQCDYKGSQSVTGIKFYAHTDNVKNGEFRVYGIVDS